MKQPHPVAGQLWKAVISSELYIFIDKVEGVGGTKIVYFTSVSSGMRYETYVKGITANYKLVSG